MTSDKQTTEDQLSHTTKIIGRLMVVLAAVMWSSSAFFVKAPIFSNNWPVEWRGLMMGFWRAVFACLILVTMVRRPSFSWKILLMSGFFVVMNFTFLTAMVEIESAATIWLQNTAPVWVFLGSYFLFKEHVTRGDWLMLGFASSGVAIILVSELTGTNASPYGISLAVISGLSYGCIVLSLRHLRGHDSAWLIFVNHLVTVLVFLPFVIWLGIVPRGNEWFYLAAFGMLQMGLPYLLFARSVRSISGHEASMLVLLEPILVPLWVFLFWRHAADYQSPSPWTLLGGLLILTGLAFRFLGRSRLGKLSYANCVAERKCHETCE